MNKTILKAMLSLLILLFMTSCVATNTTKRTEEEIMLDKGISAWNRQSPESARHYWSNLKNKKQRIEYINYIDQYNKATKELDDIVSAPPRKESKYLTAYNRMNKTYTSLPETLKIQKKTARKMSIIACGRTRALLDKNKITMSNDLITSAAETYGSSKKTDRLLTEVEILMNNKEKENDINSNLRQIRSTENFYDKIHGYEQVIVDIKNNRTELKQVAADNGMQDSKPIVSAGVRLKKKSNKVRLEMERKLRERQYSFKDRIGKEFARVPEGNKLGSMSIKEILAFQKEIKANVDAAYKEMQAFNRRYPSVIDRKMLKNVERQKKALDVRIAKVIAEIRTAKNIASRGRTVMPIMIGLFNPEKGGKKGNRKSRPAHFRGSIKKKPHYWWGMVSIPKKVMNDLVITMKDERQIRVFAKNTKSGRRIKNLKDLVNRSYKVGNSWPVLNAGNQLPSRKYFIQVQKGKKPKYKGEAVIYSSFIMRTR
jgi:predicted HicB family RNase H-like nuclease